MTRRMIDSGMWANEHFGELPMMVRLLLIGIINHADDQGRIKGHVAFLRSRIFPYDDVSTEEIENGLVLIQENNTVQLYEIDGKRYIQLVNWWEYQSLQFAMPSNYPAPAEWQDRIRFNGKGNIMQTYNWHKADGTILPDTCNHRGDPLPPVVDTQVPTKVPTQVDTPPANQVNKEYDYDQEKAKAAEPPAFLRESDSDKDGRFTMQLVSDQNLFGLFRSDAKKRAAALEETYRMEDIRSAVGVMVERHLAMVDKGERGIQDAISFLAKILHDEFKTAEDKRLVKVEVLMAPSEYHPNGHTVYDKMSLASARQSGFKIVEYLQ